MDKFHQCRCVRLISYPAPKPEKSSSATESNSFLVIESICLLIRSHVDNLTFNVEIFSHTYDREWLSKFSLCVATRKLYTQSFDDGTSILLSELTIPKKKKRKQNGFQILFVPVVGHLCKHIVGQITNYFKNKYKYCAKKKVRSW